MTTPSPLPRSARQPGTRRHSILFCLSESSHVGSVKKTLERHVAWLFGGGSCLPREAKEPRVREPLFSRKGMGAPRSPHLLLRHLGTKP